MKERKNNEINATGKPLVNEWYIAGTKNDNLLAEQYALGGVTCVFNIHGGNVQVLPNASSAVQYIYEENTHVEADSLAPYIHDERERRNYARRIAQSPDVTTLCQTVLSDMFNDVLADFTAPHQLVKSKEFIHAIIPLLTFDMGKSEHNLRHAIRKYVLGE